MNLSIVRATWLFAFLLSILLAGRSSYAFEENGRSFGLFVGGALSRSFSSVEQSGVNAKLDGWGNFAEVGLDLPFSRDFGFTPSVEIGESQLLNKYRSDSYLDQTKIKSRAVRGLFFLKGFSAGGSYRQMDIDVKTVSTTSGASSAALSGTGYSYFVGYSFTYRNALRASAEVESAHFQGSNFKLEDLSVGLRLQILLNGVLGGN